MDQFNMFLIPNNIKKNGYLRAFIVVGDDAFAGRCGCRAQGCVCGGGCCVKSPALTAQDTQVHPGLKGAMAAWVFGYESTDLQR